MKILIVASLTETATANYFISSLRRSGHELLICSDIPQVGIHRVKTGLVDVASVLRTYKFHAEVMIFFEGGSMQLLPDTTSCPDLVTCWYAIDTHMAFAKHVHIGRLFDCTFVAQKEYVDRLTACGVASAAWLPLAFAPEILQFNAGDRNIDIAYVGSDNAAMHPERSSMLSKLAESFPRHKFGRASPTEMGDIYSRSKVVFNRAVNNDVNMRVFEAMGSGAVLVTDKVVANGMECLFDEGIHYVTYRDQDDLVSVVRGLLADPFRLRSISEAAQARIMAHHTYQHRTNQLVSTLTSVSKSVSPQASDLFAACLSLGFGSDALRSAANALEKLGGGRFQNKLGKIAASWIRFGAVLVALVERIRSVINKARYA